MRDQVRFHTLLFAPPAEQSENGVELAQWLCARLAPKFVADFLDEDWGCRIFFADPRLSKITLGCAHVENNQWSIASFVQRSFMDKLLKRAKPAEELKEIISAVDAAVMAEARFSEVEWFENDERLQESNYAARPFDA